jgi:hypothetical protein
MSMTISDQPSIVPLHVDEDGPPILQQQDPDNIGITCPPGVPLAVAVDRPQGEAPREAPGPPSFPAEPGLLPSGDIALQLGAIRA